MFEIIGKYRNRLCWETVDEFDKYDDAESALIEYRMAYGRDWILAIKEIGFDKQSEA